MREGTVFMRRRLRRSARCSFAGGYAARLNGEGVANDFTAFYNHGKTSVRNVYRPFGKVGAAFFAHDTENR